MTELAEKADSLFQKFEKSAGVKELWSYGNLVLCSDGNRDAVNYKDPTEFLKSSVAQVGFELLSFGLLVIIIDFALIEDVPDLKWKR